MRVQKLSSLIFSLYICCILFFSNILDTDIYSQLTLSLMYPWRISNQDFFLDETPSEKASFGLHKISLGIKSPSNADLSKCFSTPSYRKYLWNFYFFNLVHYINIIKFFNKLLKHALTKNKVWKKQVQVILHF